MKALALDCETTTFNKGDPFDERNLFVLGGYGDALSFSKFLPNDISGLESALHEKTLVILFNGKFDLHWCNNIGIHFNVRQPIWDCQLAEFILSNQRWKYPSLDEACEKRGIGKKIDTIKLKYWNNNIDTDMIPPAELEEYLQQDVSLTYKLYLAQLAEFKKPEHASKYKLFRLGCYDLLVLQEMEYNGYLFDKENAIAEATRLEGICADLDNNLLSFFPDIPVNVGSPSHISTILYGGTIKDTVRIPIGEYKTGAKVGHTRYKLLEQEYKLPRLITPLKGTELAKEGFYSTDEDTMKNLKPTGKVKKIIDLLLERRGLEKLRSTYYNGIPDLIEKHHWKDNFVHGSLNQCVAITSRLTGTKPNQQNMPKGCKQFCISRYE